MDKVRVYELARELGITSPETIRLLKEKVQVRVKSASSTVEEDVAIKLKRLIRLEGTGTVGAEEEAVDISESKVRSAAKRRAEKARLAVLKELEEEEEEEARRIAAQKEKEEAESRCQDVEKQLKDFEEKRRAIIDQFRKEGLAEKEKIIAEAKERVTQIIEQSELTIQQEIQAARDRLKHEVVDLAAQKAREIIEKEIDEKDQDNLVNEFIERVGKIH